MPNQPDRYVIIRTLPDGTQRRVSDMLPLEAATQSCARLNGDSTNPEFEIYPVQRG